MWEAYLIHADCFIHDSRNVDISEQSRAFLAVMASELALKSLYYRYNPQGDIRGHISRDLLKEVIVTVEISPHNEIYEAVDELERHYLAPRYPEDTSAYFCCISAQVGSDHYPSIIDELISAAQIILDWVRSQLG